MTLKEKHKSFLIGTVAAAAFIFLTCTLLVVLSLVKFMTVGILIFAPIAAGAITVFFATEEQAKSRKYLIWAPWGGLIFWSFFALLFKYETIICVIILSPLYAFLSSAGGLFCGWLRRNFCNRTFSSTSTCVVLFPYLVLPLEGNLGTLTELIEAESSIRIEAPIEQVWSGIQEVPNISDKELIWTFSHSIGIPQPVSACLSRLEVGGLRDIKWQRGIHFEEYVTKIKENELLEYEVKVDPGSMAIKELDTHIVIGDQYFDVTHGAYTLQKVEGATLLTLKTGYRISTKINFYGKFWASYVFDDFHSSVLNVIKNRVEHNQSQRCRDKVK
ncbi:hypothetical protein [Aliikangiella maris]|uniref:Uncharacterized protein n=2 Tax=Aliikangiella maris TaxID=3162458 RepID=A0ABV3MSG9_9GAMM